MRTWTEEEIKQKIQTKQSWLEHAVVAIFNFQTLDEKQTECTRHWNGVGFNGCDARRLTYYAKWLKAGKHLTGRHLDIARVRMAKYVKQLTRLANQIEQSREVQ